MIKPRKEKLIKALGIVILANIIVGLSMLAFQTAKNSKGAGNETRRNPANNTTR